MVVYITLLGVFTEYIRFHTYICTSLHVCSVYIHTFLQTFVAQIHTGSYPSYNLLKSIVTLAITYNTYIGI